MAYSFDGSGDHINFTKSALATGLAQISYSFHVQRDSGMTGYREIFWSGGSWHDNFHSFIQHNTNNTTFDFVANWSGAEARWQVARDDSGVWTNHVVTYDYGSTSNDPIWYKNGSSVTVTEIFAPSGSSQYTTDTGNLRIAAYENGSAEYWLGKIAEFGIWNRILTPTEAAILGKGFSPLFIPNGLVFYAPLVRNTQDIRSGRTGTVTNAVVFPHPLIIYPSPSYGRRYTTATTPVSTFFPSRRTLRGIGI